MNADSIVSKLLEDDPKDYLRSTTDPTESLIAVLRDELVEKGWRRIQLFKEEDVGNTWELHARYIDTKHRTAWNNAGARVIPGPDGEDRNAIGMVVMRMFTAALKRAGFGLEAKGDLRVEPGEAFDLHSLADTEDDPGDWEISLQFTATPLPGFWGKAGNAIGYEPKPASKPALPPNHYSNIMRKNGILQGDEADRIYRRLNKKSREELPAAEELEMHKEWAKRTTGPV